MSIKNIVSGQLPEISTYDAGGNITGLNINGNVTANSFIGDGSQLTGLPAGYTDANVTTLLASGNVTSNIITTGNVSGTYFIGDGSLLTGIPPGYTDANVSAYLASGADTANIITSADISGNNLVASNNITSGANVDVGTTLNVQDITGASMQISATGLLQNISFSATGNIDVGSTFINRVSNPAVATDAATKYYVDASAQGLNVKVPANLATVSALPAYTYNNGNVGVGATITGSATGNLTIDGTLAVLNNRVLVKDETAGNAPYNGIYVVTTAGAPGVAYELTRATDNDTAAAIYGGLVFINGGNTNIGTSWFDTNQSSVPVTVGTTDIDWVQFSSSTVTPGNGLSQVGSLFNVNTDNVTTTINGSNQVVVKPSANLVTPNIGNAVGNSLTVTGNVSTSANINAGYAVISGNVVTGNILTNGYYFANGTPLSFDTTGINNGSSNVEIPVANSAIIFNVNGAYAGAINSNVAILGNASGTNGFYVNPIRNDVSNIANVVYYNAATKEVTYAPAAQTYGNANVAAYLANATTNGDIYSGNLRTSGFLLSTGNITTDASLNVAGVANIVGNLSVGGNITGGNAAINGNITGNNVTLTGALVATSVDSGYFTTPLGTNGNITIDPDGTGVFVITPRTPSYFANTANSTSSTTGAVTFAGGVGIAGNLNVGGNFSAADTNFTNITVTNAGNIGNLTVPGLTTLTGNTTTGNINTTGSITATGDVSGANITGTGNITTATGNVNGGNVMTSGVVNASGNVIGANFSTSGVVTATGAITGGNLNTAGTANVGTLAVVGNATVGNNLTVGGAFITANITTAGYVLANGNVTGGNINTAGIVSATGNVSGGNLTTTGDANVTGNIYGNFIFAAANVVAAGNVDAPAVNTPLVYGDTVEITATGLNADISLTTNGTGNIVLNSTYINGLINPVQAQDAATKAYVDSVAVGLQYKVASNVATTVGLPAYTYNNGTFGVGATITGNVNGALVIDTVTVIAGDRVLVKNEGGTEAPYNGIYDVTVPGDAGNAYVLTRSSDDDTAADMYGAYTFVEAGADNGTTSWICTATSSNPINIGFDAINWVQFSRPSEYSAGNGLALNGTIFSVAVDNNTTGIIAGNVVVKAGANLTTPNIGNATGNSLTLVGNGNISGNSITLSGIATITGNATAGNLSTGIITATGNITSGNNLIVSGYAEVTGNVSGNNMNVANSLSVIGDATVNNTVSVLTDLYVGPTANTTTFTGPVIFAEGSANGFSQIGLISKNGDSSADLITYANNGTDADGYADIGVTGNTFNDTNYTITAPNDGYFFVQGTSGSGGNLVVATGSSGNTHDIVFATGGFLTANEKLRLVDASNKLIPYANATFNLGDSTHYYGDVYAKNLDLIGNIAGNNITATSNISGGNLSITGLSSLGVANVTFMNAANNITVAGTANIVGNVTAGNVTVGLGTVVTNVVNANTINVNTYANLGLVNNVKILGGAPGQMLSTDGNGILSWATGGAGAANIQSIPAVYFTSVANANNQTFSNVVLAGYPNANVMTVFYNGALLENNNYSLSADTLTINTPLVVGDSIDVISQYTGVLNTVLSGYGNSNVAAFFNNYAGNFVPAATNAYYLGNTTNVWNGMYAANVVASNVSANNSSANSFIGGSFNGTTITASGNVTSGGTVTGANIVTGGSVTATGNVNGGGLYINGSGIVTGNLQVQGNLVYNNLTNLTTSNLVLGLGNTSTGANVNGGGIVVGNTAEASFLYNFSSQSWVSNIGLTSNTTVLGANVTATNTVTGNLVTGNTITAIGNVTGANVNATTLRTTTAVATGNITGANVNAGGVYATTVTATGNIAGNNIGNITAVNLNGSSSQYLAGDGTWKSASAGAMKNITKIDAFGYASIMIIADGDMYCIKGNGNGDGCFTSGLGTHSPDILSGVNNCYALTFPYETPGTLVDGGTYGQSAYALFANGNLYTWGRNDNGQLGLGNTSSVYFPTPSNTNVAQVYTHPSNSNGDPYANRLIIRKNDNTFWGCGYNAGGALGLGNLTPSITSWTQMPWIPTDVLSVWNLGSNGGCTMIQKADGSIWVTGWNNRGQLGIGNNTAVSIPVSAPNWLGGDSTMRIQSIYFGGSYRDSGGFGDTQSTTMLLDNGTTSRLVASGSNNWGNLGNGTTTDTNTPVAPLATTGLAGRITKVRGVGSSVATMFVQLANGDLFTYGYNNQGCVGNGTTASAVSTPYKVFSGTVADILGDQQGWYYDTYLTPTPLIKKTDGTYWCWGYSPFGQAGTVSTAANLLTPAQVAVPKGTLFENIATFTGYNSGTGKIGVTTDNALIVYGYNNYWNIDPTTTESLIVPTTFTPNNLRK